MDYHAFLADFPDTYLGVGPADAPRIALTFDDGPGAATPALLALLRDVRVKASFFCVGTAVARRAEVIAEIVRDGHDLGNHSFSHVDATTQSLEAFWHGDVVPATVQLERLAGRPVRLYRPPYGEISPGQVRRLGAAGHTVVGWSIDPGDWSEPDAPDHVRRVIDTVVAQAHPGAIVLLHDGDDGHVVRHGILEIVRGLVPRLRRAGFEFVGVGDLLRLRERANRR
ncbi:polysaccharide deacetylase family protein [Luteimonas abyssi]|uniref:polysaccharide deacetylase family protein n=1 Tax=Luteimonas abyssi TaxID=1247514 RepID=UPI000737BED4|nr:polysaccharide deacetylase family protein [Luteimonas abyssi]